MRNIHQPSTVQCKGRVATAMTDSHCSPSTCCVHTPLPHSALPQNPVQVTSVAAGKGNVRHREAK